MVFGESFTGKRMNIFYGLVLVLTCFALLLIFFRLWGKAGVLVWTALGVVLANIQVVKTVDYYGITATLGNALYGSVFLATDILNEYYGEKTARTAVWIGFGASLTMAVCMQLAIQFVPAEGDFGSDAIAAIFNPAVRVVAGSLCAYLISQFMDVRLYNIIGKRFPGYRFLWLRNNGAAIISQLADTLIFVTAAFAGMYPTEILMEIYITTWLFKAGVSLIDTPFMYLSKKIRPEEGREIC